MSRRLAPPTPHRKIDSFGSRFWCQVPQWALSRLPAPVVPTYIHLKILLRSRRRICHRHLASQRGVCIETIRLHVRAMERAGVLRTVHKRIGPRRNAPNLYILLDIDGRDLVVAYPQKKLQETISRLRTNTPPSRRLNHSPALRKVYDWNARLMAENRGLRAILRKDELPSQPTAQNTGLITADEIERMGGDAVIRCK